MMVKLQPQLAGIFVAKASTRDAVAILIDFRQFHMNAIDKDGIDDEMGSRDEAQSQLK